MHRRHNSTTLEESSRTKLDRSKFELRAYKLCQLGQLPGSIALRNLTLSGAFLLCLSTVAQAQSPLGNWARGDGNARVRIAPCGANLCATNTWIRNPGSEKVGQVLIMKVRKVAARLWKGSAYDPQRKLSVSMEMKVGQGTMSTSGCVFGGLLCKTTSWTRRK